MASPLYQEFQPQNNFLDMVQQFRDNPIVMLSKRFNIPQNLNDPNEIIQHLLNTKQVSQEQINRVMQMSNDPRVRRFFTDH